MIPIINPYIFGGGVVTLFQDNFNGSAPTQPMYDTFTNLGSETITAHTSDSGAAWTETDTGPWLGGVASNNLVVNNGYVSTTGANKQGYAVSSVSHSTSIMIDIYFSVPVVNGGASKLGVQCFDEWTDGMNSCWAELMFANSGDLQWTFKTQTSGSPSNIGVGVNTISGYDWTTGIHNLKILVSQNRQDLLIDGVLMASGQNNISSHTGRKIILYLQSDTTHAQQIVCEAIRYYDLATSGSLATHSPEIGGAYYTDDLKPLSFSLLDGAGKLNMDHWTSWFYCPFASALGANDKFKVECGFTYTNVTPTGIPTGLGQTIVTDISAINSGTYNWLVEMKVSFDGIDWFVDCYVNNSGPSYHFGDTITPQITSGSYHTMRYEVEPLTPIVRFYLDDVLIASTSEIPEEITDQIWVQAQGGESRVGKFDFVKATKY